MLWHNSKQENVAQPIGQLGSCHSAARQDYPVVPSHPKQEEKKNQQKKAKIPLNPIVFLFDLDVKFYMCMSCEGYVCSLVWKNAGEGQNLSDSLGYRGARLWISVQCCECRRPALAVQDVGTAPRSLQSSPTSSSREPSVRLRTVGTWYMFAPVFTHTN